MPEQRGRAAIPAVEWAAWFAALAAVTVTMLAFRSHLNEGHITLAYLLVVQGASARAGRPLGISLAAAAFVCFDFFFLPPYGTLVINDPLNWLVLAAFLATSVLSAQLLYRAQAEAEAARQRASEIDRLASLGAETLNAPRAEEALDAIVTVIRTSLALADCAVFTIDACTRAATLASRSTEEHDPSPMDLALVERLAADGIAAVELTNGTMRTGAASSRFDDDSPARALLRPLQVRGITVGMLRAARQSGFKLSSSQLRVLDALAYYAALGVERVRLVGEAERAAALQESHRAKDAVLASVSHDLRTPLTTIKGLAHELAAGGDDRAEIIEEEADRLNAFVAQVLDLSRISSGGAAADVQANEAEDLLGAAAQQVAGRMHGRELRIAVSTEDPLLFGRFDFSQTLRALVNLIDNAAKYSPAGAPVDLSARRDGEWLVFAVADRGRGVPPDERERIFEAFYRPSGSASDAGGAGLGLSIARGIVEAEGGTLTLESRDGGGSVFTIRVPGIDPSSLQVPG